MDSFTFGKFSLLHKGHEKLFLDALGECQVLHIGVSTHPRHLPVDFRIEVIKTLLAPYVAAGRVKFIANPGMFPALEEAGENVTVYLGEDRERDAKDLSRWCKGGYRTVRRVTSSTACRALLDASEDVSALVPEKVLKYAKKARKMELHG